ncbi:uracil-DNA glycosylase [Nereida sp. MMG025]|uniref:uracil-DNA glycosylase n=1 Tax=Nereida sp. MMG025 TaxID=2909981 RepID=UPI001F43491B|nr:uracil-DNA glycosylase [Nereida sp. MMG025]MCF6444383.1 uracil-DNA glycosylase [Nereida sp. MMG025]
MESSLDHMDWHAARAALEWQVDLGVDECIADAPINRYETPAQTPKPVVAKRAAAPAVMQPVETDAVAEARKAAEAAGDLAALKHAMGQFEHCDLKRGAQHLVFADGVAEAPLMIVGEAPGRDEDIAGVPFVGAAGQLLDKMLAAIGRSRATDTYITNVMPWRPPQNRDPKPLELAMMVPFIERHIALAKPQVIVAMGNISCQALLGRKGVTRLRGTWADHNGTGLMPMFHPAYLLRNPVMKREAWADLLQIKARLEAS